MVNKPTCMRIVGGACAACRANKSTCALADKSYWGVPGPDMRCVRCARLGRECEWPLRNAATQCDAVLGEPGTAGECQRPVCNTVTQCALVFGVPINATGTQCQLLEPPSATSLPRKAPDRLEKPAPALPRRNAPRGNGTMRAPELPRRNGVGSVRARTMLNSVTSTQADGSSVAPKEPSREIPMCSTHDALWKALLAAGYCSVCKTRSGLPEEVGRGTHGVVWICSYSAHGARRDQREFALKVPSLKQIDAHCRAAATEHSALMALRNCAHVVQLVRCIPHPDTAGAVRILGHMIISVEFVDNVQYTHDVVRNMPEAQLKSAINTIVEGLTAMHARGYAHGDIKPANVLLRADLRSVVYVDFAMAYPLPRTFAGLPFYGTVGFGHPDCVRMSKAHDIGETCGVHTDTGQLDEYAAGVTAICMVMGRGSCNKAVDYVKRWLPLNTVQRDTYSNHRQLDAVWAIINKLTGHVTM